MWLIEGYIKSYILKDCSNLEFYCVMMDTYDITEKIGIVASKGNYKKSEKVYGVEFLKCLAEVYFGLSVRFPNHGRVIIEEFSVKIIYEDIYSICKNKDIAVIISGFLGGVHKITSLCKNRIKKIEDILKRF